MGFKKTVSMFQKILLTLSIAFITTSLLGQKKVIDHTVYNDWKSVKRSIISPNGDYVSYEVNPHRGDGYLHWLNTKTKAHDSIKRGKNGHFSQGTDVLVFSLDPGYDTIRTLKLKEEKKDNWVKDTLGILYLSGDSSEYIPNLIDFKLSEKTPFVAYRIEADSLKQPEPKKKKCKLFGKKKEEEEISSKGETLFVKDLSKGSKSSYKHVVKYVLSKKGNALAMVTHKKVEDADSFQIHLLDLKTAELKTDPNRFTAVDQMNFSEKGRKFAFVASTDTSENKLNALFTWNVSENKSKRLVHSERADLSEAMNVSKHYKPYFSLNEQKLFLGLSDMPE